MNSMINILPLKRFVLRSYPENSALYQIMVSEKDELPEEEVLIKGPIWLDLADLHSER